MSGDLGNDLDLPYEDSPDGPFVGPPTDYEMSGGVVVLAAVVPVEGVGPMPCLVFRFAKPMGEFYPDRALILDDRQMLKIGELILKASASARRETKAARR